MSNTAGAQGAGIFASSAITVTNVNFINNQAAGPGGGLRASASALVSGGRFERNVAANSGGAIAATGALTLTNVVVISNTSTSATFDGGGIHADGGLFMLASLVHNNNSA